MKNDTIKTTINAFMDTSSGDIQVNLHGSGEDLIFLCGVLIRQIAASVRKDSDEALMKAISMASIAALECSEEGVLIDLSQIPDKD